MFIDWLFPLAHWNEFVNGASMTLLITLITFAGAFVLGVLLGIARFIKRDNFIKSTLYFVSTAYVETIRNTPALVQIYLVYFGLPEFGISLQPVTAGIIALIINNSAFIAEVVRGGLQSIPKGQQEAALSIGLDSLQVFRLVIFPQAMRNIFPAMGNQILLVVFCTALLASIDVRELTDVAMILNADTFRALESFLSITVIYYILTFFISRITVFINNKFFPVRA